MKSSPKQTDYPIYSEGKLSERKQLFHLSLRNRLPALRQTPISESDTDSQNDERQALKRIVVFFAVMLILTLVARGTSSAIRPVVTTQQAKAGTISQSVQSSGSITASSVLSVSLPEGIVLDNILVKEGQSVVEGQTLATCDVDELSTKLDRAKASLQKSKAEYNQLLSNAVLDDTSVARTQQALLRAYEADQKAYEELEKLRASENPAPEAISTAEQAADDDADNINDFERVKEAAVHSEATEFIDALPLGYRTTLEKEWNGGTELSGGQWQKIAIARCFYKSSSVVILDEPFSAIDSFSEEQIIKSLASDTINKMCIFVTHRFNNICLADQILVLKDAQLIENGTHAQLMATNGLYARLYHAQADAFFTLSQSEVQEE